MYKKSETDPYICTEPYEQGLSSKKNLYMHVYIHYKRDTYIHVYLKSPKKIHVYMHIHTALHEEGSSSTLAYIYVYIYIVKEAHTYL